MSFQSVRDLNVKGHRVFLRADLNVPLKDGKIGDATRIRETLPTLRCLLEGGASVVMASHLGRPEGKGFEAAYSAAPVAALFKYFGKNGSGNFPFPDFPAGGKVVLTITGNGLKDPDTAKHAVTTPVETEANAQAIREALGKA